MSRLNSKSLAFLTTLERRFGLLSSDLLDQDALFEMQEMIMNEMIKAAKSSAVGFDLAAELPHLFSRK